MIYRAVEDYDLWGEYIDPWESPHLRMFYVEGQAFWSHLEAGRRYDVTFEKETE